MKKAAVSLILALTVTSVFAVASFAQSLPSSKAAVQLSELTLIEYQSASSADWGKLLSTSLRTSQQKDLIIGASLETGLFTRTLVKSQKLVTDISMANAGIQVRVVIDKGTTAQRIAYPGPVVFDQRKQELTASFAGALDSCTDVDGDGTVEVPSECTFDDESLQLTLETMGAHHFNFVIDNLGAGIHTVELQAMIFIDVDFMAGEAEAKALIGKGSLTVEEIRLVKGAEIIMD